MTIIRATFIGKSEHLKNGESYECLLVEDPPPMEYAVYVQPHRHGLMPYRTTSDMLKDWSNVTEISTSQLTGK